MNKHTPTPWQIGKYHSVVSDSPVPEMRGSDDVYHYGGHMVCESVTTDNAAHIVRCVNSHDALVRIAELVQHAAQNRADRDWTQFHLDLSEAAELAKQVAPLAAATPQTHLDKQFEEPLSMLSKLTVKP